MQALRGIADDGESLRDVTLGPRQHERVRSALADAQEASEPEAERRLELAQELVVRQREQSARPPRACASRPCRSDRR